MLKISKTRESRNDVLLKLEGKITQEWATLLDGICRTYLQRRKAVQLDCANVDFIDATGVDVLKKFPRQRVSLVSTPGFVTELVQIGMAMNLHALAPTAELGHAECAIPETPRAKVSFVTQGEAQLVARLRKGDQGAFAELVNQSHGALIRMAMRYVADRDAAEEVVQDTWMAVIGGVNRFEGRSSLKTWIMGILIHKAKDRGIRESRHIAFSAFESHDDESEEAVDPSRFHPSGELAGSWSLPPQPWDEQTPERLLASKQGFEALSAAVDELPPTLREVLLLKDVEGLESKDICELLKISEANLYVRLHRARERVRVAVETSMLGRRKTM